MHLCIITHSLRKNDGQGRVNYALANEAIFRGWKVTFIGSYLSDDLAGPSLTWLRVPRTKLPTLLHNLVFAWKASNLVNQYRHEFDVIHANGFIVWSRVDVNTAHFVHSGWLKSKFYSYRPVNSFYKLYQYTYTKLNSILERYAFRRATMLVAVSEKVKDEIAATGAQLGRISTIYNGVDLEEFRPGSGNRERFGLPLNETLFLFAGDIKSTRKNLESVIGALKYVQNIHLVVAGNANGSPYPQLAKDVGLSERVHFLDMVTDMPSLMRSVDAFVFPSRYEACSLAILEALASGLPVLTASTAGGSEVVKDAGIVICDPNNIIELSSAMRTLADNKSTRSTMSGKALEVASTLSWQEMADRYFSIYEWLAAAAPASDRKYMPQVRRDTAESD